MQDNPKAKDLLDAIADFLLKEVIPAVEGKDSISYKALVSWNMLGILSREWGKEEIQIQEEYLELSKWISHSKIITNPLTIPEIREAISEMNQILALKIRNEKISIENQDLWNFEKSRIEQRLKIANPRFSIDH